MKKKIVFFKYHNRLSTHDISETIGATFKLKFRLNLLLFNIKIIFIFLNHRLLMILKKWNKNTFRNNWEVIFDCKFDFLPTFMFEILFYTILFYFFKNVLFRNYLTKLLTKRCLFITRKHTKIENIYKKIIWEFNFL